MKTKSKMAKRIISLVLTLLMVLTMIPMSVFSTFAAEAAQNLTATIDTGAEVTLKDADGDSYYDIGNADELYAFAALVNGGNVAINAELTANIVVNEGVMTASSTGARKWTPIGNHDYRYTGTFDGKDFTVSGLYFNDSDVISYVGMFGHVGENGKVQNTGVINSYLAGYLYVGGVVGWNWNGSVENCYNTGEVSGNEIVGGVVGENYGTIENCYNTGTVSGTDHVGGVTGWNFDKITNCYNTGTVSGTGEGRYYVGGVVAVNAGTVENCYNTGTVSGYAGVGGVVSSNLYSTVKNCYYLDKVNDVSNPGGINGEDAEGSAEAKTIDQFKSGEVAYLLQGEQTDEVWGQTIGEDDYPVLGGDIVYRSLGCASYSNTNTGEYKPHELDDNGFCIVCGGYEPAKLNNNGTAYNTSDDYYEIENAGQLYWFTDKVNNDNKNYGSANAILTKDIIVNEGVMSADSTDARKWTPIGNYYCQYTGTFDGKGFTVSGLYFNDSDVDYVGMFGYVGEGDKVQNIGVINSYFNGNFCVSGVVGLNYNGTIENCYNTGTVSGTDYVGGVVGYNYRDTVENCYNTGTVSGTDYVGGVIGLNDYSTITNCYYLDTACTGGINGEDAEDSAEAKTIDQFKSGEVAYLLQGDQTEKIWGQKIGTDTYPVLGGDKVYQVENCKSETAYSNTNENIDHVYENGKCTVCEKDCVHTGGTATCNKKAVCDDCGMEYGDFDPYAHAGERTPEFRFNTPYETEDSKECYVELYLFCADCDEFVDSTSGYASLVDSKEPTDCMNPGYEIYETTLSVDGVYYPVSHKVTLKSDNHVGEFENGFCSECGGYEPAKLNDNGTPDDEWDDYYEISNAGQLYWYAQKLNEENAELHVKLINDIVISEDAPNWTPINSSYAYFDGNFKTISGLKCIDTEATYVGLFGNEGWWYEISNLHITNSYFEGKDNVGAVVASLGNGGFVKNCYVTNTTVKGDDNVGTLVGHLGLGHVINCYVDMDTLVGHHTDGYGSIENSYYLSDTDDGNGGKTAEQFASGEVAYLLQAGVPEEDIYDDEWNYIDTIIPEIWGQTIGTDKYPVLGGDKVYEVTNCQNENIYSNTNENGQHNFDENGFCTGCDVLHSSVDADGDGYYDIGNADELYAFAALVNSGKTAINAELTADIIVNEGEMTADSTDAIVWTPIGNSSGCQYTGTFDGNDHTVSGLYFNNSGTKFVGLLGYVGENGVVKNTGVINSYFNGSTRVGGVVGLNYGSIENCYNTSYISGESGVGGVVGINSGTIKKCYNAGNVVGIDIYVGGVVGYSYSTIENCYNLGSVSGDSFVGGVVGLVESGSVSNCYNIGKTTRNNGYVGGVVAFIDKGTIENCYYLDTACSGGINGEDVEGSAEAKTAEEFASGEVAYLLQGEQTDEVWGQTIGEDDYPVFDGDKVYTVANCKNEILNYSNTKENITHIDFDENGFCIVCDAFEPAKLNNKGTADDTSDDYYEISNAGQLYWFADKVNNDNANYGSADAILTKDIVVNEGEMTAASTDASEWTPIGNSNNNYTGTFDGKDFTVSGLYFNDSSVDYVGLFGYVGENGQVTNTSVINSYFNGSYYVGGIVGYSYGTITNCHNTGIVIGKVDVGGIVGYSYGTITNCYNTGSISGQVDVGGVAGSVISGTFINCHNTGVVSGKTVAGGMIGYAQGGAVTNCYNTGDVIGDVGSEVIGIGGVVGRNFSATITNCYNTGSVSGKISSVGGVAGHNRGTIINCYNTGTVSSTKNNIGGVVGLNYGTITNCYNTGSVSGSNYVGGVAGGNYVTVENCYYLNTACTGGINGEDAEGSAEVKTAEEFASGEVAYLLQAGVPEEDIYDDEWNYIDTIIPEIWGQTIGTDKYPTLGGDKVYEVTNCQNENIYSNTNENGQHNFDENGFCKDCDEIIALKFSSASLTLQNAISVNFKVDSKYFTSYGYENPYVVFEINGESVTTTDYTIDGDKYVFTFSDVSPKNMNDTITATLYATLNGEEQSAAKDYSIATYCYNMLSKCEDDAYAEFRTLIVDLLNYGAAAQVYENYNVDNLANADLTDAQKAWATATVGEYNTVTDTKYNTIENPTVTFKSAGLNLQDAITMRFKLDTESVEDLTVKIQVGEKAFDVPANEFLAVDDGYYVFFYELNPYQLRETVLVTVYDGDTAVSNTLSYSVESYAYSKQNSGDEALVNLINAMMKYGDAAYAYVN